MEALTGPSPPAQPQPSRAATSNRLSKDNLEILERLLHVGKLTNRDIAYVFKCDERTVRRRKYQYLELGKLVHKHPEVAKNAEKMKPEHLEVSLLLLMAGLWLTLRQKLQEWHKDNENALLEDMQKFLEQECGLMVSVSTISRHWKVANGSARKRQRGTKRRPKLKQERDSKGGELDRSPPRTGEASGQAAISS